MTDSNQDADEALLVALGRRARERVEHGTASLLEASPSLSAEDLESVTATVLERTAPVVNERPPARTAVLLLVVAATLAAGLLLWFGLDGEPDPVPSIAQYEGDFVGGLRETRDADASTEPIARLRPDSPFTWTLVPKTAVHVPVDVRLEARSDGEVRCLKVPKAALTVHERGGVEIESTAKHVFTLPTGRWTVRALVGAASAFDADAPCAVVPGTVVADEHEIDLLN